MKDDIIFQHLLDSLKELHGKTEEIRVIQARMEENLAYHIKRTDLLEEKVESQGKLIDVMSAPFRLVVWVLKTVRIIK